MQFIHGLVRKRASVLKFLAVGCISLAIDYGSLLLLYRVFGIALPVAATGAFLVGLAVNFSLNKYWTFGAPRGAGQSSRQAALYGLLVVVNLVLTNFFVVSAAAIGIGPEVSKPVATALIMVLNYFVYQTIIFT